MISEETIAAIFAGTVIIPYGIYTWAYKWPKHFLKHMTQDQMIWLSSILHSISFITYGMLCYNSGLVPGRLIFTIPLIAVGQMFNYLVYTRLGKVRAYYGWELELYSGPIVTGFPFDVIADSQYKGCIMCVLGTCLSFNYNPLLAILTGYWIALYVYMIFMENTAPGRPIPSD